MIGVEEHTSNKPYIEGRASCITSASPFPLRMSAYRAPDPTILARSSGSTGKPAAKNGPNPTTGSVTCFDMLGRMQALCRAHSVSTLVLY